MLSWLQVAELGLELSPEGALQPGSQRHRCGKPDDSPGMVETKDLAQLRQLNLELLRQLWVGQDAMRRSVAKAALEVGVHLGNSQRMRGAANPQARSQASRVILMLMRKQVQPGKGLDWDTAEARAGVRTQAFMPSTCQLGG